MNRLHRYLFLECGRSALAALVVLTFLTFLPKMLTLVDFWINKEVSVAVLGGLMWNLLPKFVLYSLPLALLLGILMALGRLSQNSELVIFKASGLSLYQIAGPIAILALLFAMASALLSHLWVPEAYRAFSDTRLALSTARLLNLKNHTFNHNLPGMTLYVSGHSPDGKTLSGLLLDDRRPGAPETLIAQRGVFVDGPEGTTQLHLSNGSRHFQTSAGRYRQLAFSSYTLDLGVALGMKEITRPRDPVEMDPLALWRATSTADPQQAREARLEWHYRWAVATATLVVGLLAIPLGVHSHRQEGGYGFPVAVALLVLHFLLLSLGMSLSKRGVLDPLAGYWLPNLLMASFTAHIIQAAARERPVRAVVLVELTLERLLARLTLRRRPRE